MKPYKDFQESFLKRLKEPSEAAAFINATIETGDAQDFLVAIFSNQRLALKTGVDVCLPGV